MAIGGHLKSKSAPAGGNDWEPSAAFDPGGGLWVAYDTYRSGNYDVYLTHTSGGKIDREETAVADSPKFEARATLAVDASGRVFVAWEEGGANWGKDQGYVPGVSPPRACLWEACAGRACAFSRTAGGALWTIALPAHSRGAILTNPHVFVDSKNIDYQVTRFDGTHWSRAVILPHSRGRSSTRISGVPMPDGNMLLAWSTDNTHGRFLASSHSPGSLCGHFESLHL